MSLHRVRQLGHIATDVFLGKVAGGAQAAEEAQPLARRLAGGCPLADLGQDVGVGRHDHGQVAAPGDVRGRFGQTLAAQVYALLRSLGGFARPS